MRSARSSSVMASSLRSVRSATTSYSFNSASSSRSHSSSIGQKGKRSVGCEEKQQNHHAKKNETNQVMIQQADEIKKVIYCPLSSDQNHNMGATTGRINRFYRVF